MSLEWSNRRIIVVFFVAGTLFYAPSWSNYFVADDYEFLGRVSIADAARYFSVTWGYGNEYRPLLAYSYALNFRWSGYSPEGYHAVNTVLHIACAILLTLVCERGGVPRSAAALAGILFLINPVAHESVLWISGRPVLLSAFFALASVLAFLKTRDDRRRRWSILLNVLIALGLLSYEGAVAIPLLVCLLSVLTADEERQESGSVLSGPLALLAAYIIYWNLFFSGKIMRFPVESSFQGALRSLFAAATHSFHGICRPALLPLYALVIGSFLRYRAGWRFALACLALFVTAYLPFFIVRGFADRFAYLSSAAAMTLLAAALFSLRQRSRRLGAALTIGVVAFFAIGMQNRIAIWKEAGEIARRIPLEIKRVHPSLPPRATVVVLNAPHMYKHALVYMTGLSRALERLYPATQLKVRTTAAESAEGDTFIFEYANGCIAPR